MSPWLLIGPTPDSKAIAQALCLFPELEKKHTYVYIYIQKLLLQRMLKATGLKPKAERKKEDPYIYKLYIYIVTDNRLEQTTSLS